MDRLTSEQRHKNMSRIHSKDTSIEVMLRKALWHKGYRYRKNYKLLPGSPDIAITKYKIAIFCDSEFFHGKNWVEVLRPRIKRGSNPQYWENKIMRNMARDSSANRALTGMGWAVIRFWGDEIKKDIDGCVDVVEEVVLDQMVASAEPDYSEVLQDL